MKRQYNHDQMLGLYEQWQASGKSKTAFAEVHRIPPTTFYYWARKFEQSESAEASGFHQISVDEPSFRSSGELMAAVQYPSGIRLELYSSFQNLSSSYVQLLKSLTE